MPQLDRYAFVSEVLWLVIAFWGLYLLIAKDGLPKIYKTVKVRKNTLVDLLGGVFGVYGGKNVSEGTARLNNKIVKDTTEGLGTTGEVIKQQNEAEEDMRWFITRVGMSKIKIIRNAVLFEI